MNNLIFPNKTSSETPTYRLVFFTLIIVRLLQLYFSDSMGSWIVFFLSNKILLMHWGASAVWHTSLTLLNSFNKTKAVSSLKQAIHPENLPFFYINIIIYTFFIYFTHFILTGVSYQPPRHPCCQHLVQNKLKKYLSLLMHNKIKEIQKIFNRKSHNKYIITLLTNFN